MEAVDTMAREANAWPGSGQTPEPPSEPDARAAWLASFTWRWLLIALAAALVLGDLTEIVARVVDASSFDRVKASLGWVAFVLRCGAVIALAVLVGGRLWLVASIAVRAAILLVLAQVLLAMAWSNISLELYETPLAVLVSVVASTAAIARTSARAAAYGLAGLGIALHVVAVVLPMVTGSPSDGAFTLGVVADVVMLGLFVVARHARLSPRPLTRMRDPASRALAGLWQGPCLLLGAQWFVAVVGALMPPLVPALQIGLVGAEALSLVLVFIGVRALLGANIPTSVAAPAVVAVLLHSMGALLTLGAAALKLASLGPVRGGTMLSNARAIADVLFMGAAVASSATIGLAARWAGEEAARKRATTATRLALATFVVFLPPLAWMTSEQRNLGALALDVCWMGGLILLWKALAEVRPALTRRALVDAL